MGEQVNSHHLFFNGKVKWMKKLIYKIMHFIFFFFYIYFFNFCFCMILYFVCLLFLCLVELNLDVESNNLRRACSLSDLSAPNKIVHAKPVQGMNIYLTTEILPEIFAFFFKSLFILNIYLLILKWLYVDSQ